MLKHQQLGPQHLHAAMREAKRRVRLPAESGTTRPLSGLGLLSPRKKLRFWEIKIKRFSKKGCPKDIIIRESPILSLALCFWNRPVWLEWRLLEQTRTCTTKHFYHQLLELHEAQRELHEAQRHLQLDSRKMRFRVMWPPWKNPLPNLQHEHRLPDQHNKWHCLGREA